MTNKQPEALRLADLIDDRYATYGDIDKAADEMRRLHEVNEELVEALRVVVRGVPDTWQGVKQAYIAIAKATGEQP